MRRLCGCSLRPALHILTRDYPKSYGLPNIAEVMKMISPDFTIICQVKRLGTHLYVPYSSLCW